MDDLRDRLPATGEGALPETPPHAAIRFSIGSEFFGLPLEDVAEIQEASSITPLPSAPDFLSGVTNIHGRLCSVVRMDRILGIDRAPGSAGYLVILIPERGGMALHVDASRGIARYSVLEEVSREKGEAPLFIEGVFLSEGKIVSVVNPSKLQVWIDQAMRKGDE